MKRDEVSSARSTSRERSKRSRSNCVPPPTFVRGAGFTGRVDRWQEFEYVAPGVVLQWSGGIEVGNILIDPPTVNVVIPIRQELFRRAVAIVPELVDAPADGFRIAAITVQPLNVVVVLRNRLSGTANGNVMKRLWKPRSMADLYC